MAKSKKIIPISDTQAAIGAGAIMSFFVVWALIAGVGDDFVCWIGGKSNLSGWVQAVGSIGAIIGVWWQTNHQIRIDQKNRKTEELNREIASLERALFIVANLSSLLGKKKLHVMAISTSSTMPEAKVAMIGAIDVFSRQLINFPYWEMPDTTVARYLQSVLQSVSVLRLDFEFPSLDTNNRLDEALAACKHAENACEARLSLRQRERGW